MTARRVLLASPRGCCAGVDRAIGVVEALLDRHGPPVYVRRQIVHNTHVIEDLAARGAIFVEELDEVPDAAVVVYSAHGVAPSVRAEGARRGLHAVDATCPLVAKVHQEARRLDRDDKQILLIGHRGHEEVDGTLGHAPDRMVVIDSPEAADQIQVRDPSRVAWLSQTTLAVDEVMAIVDRLRCRFPLLEDPPSSDICYASQNRQNAVKAIAAECDLLLVVGSANSSNSARLVEVARAAGAPAAYLIDDETFIDDRWLVSAATIGVTGGASVPETLTQHVVAALVARGYTDVSEVTVTAETQVFGLPGLEPAR